MGQSSYSQSLDTRFTQLRLTTDMGAVFVPSHPVDLEHYFDSRDSDDEPPDSDMTAFERLIETGSYQLVLSLSWGHGSAPGRTLDLGLLRVAADKLFVVHQVDDDAGTSLILAYLSAEVPSQLFRPFLIDYLGSRGAGYTVNLPGLLPQTIWIVQPEIAPHVTVATGLLGLVTPEAAPWGDVHWRVCDAEHQGPARPQGLSMLA